MSFWEKAILRTEKHMLRQTIDLARTNADFKIKHPDEARDLTLETPNKARTVKRIKEELAKNAILVKERENKIGGKN